MPLSGAIQENHMRIRLPPLKVVGASCRAKDQIEVDVGFAALAPSSMLSSEAQRRGRKPKQDTRTVTIGDLGPYLDDLVLRETKMRPSHIGRITCPPKQEEEQEEDPQQHLWDLHTQVRDEERAVATVFSHDASGEWVLAPEESVTVLPSAVTIASSLEAEHSLSNKKDSEQDHEDAILCAISEESRALRFGRPGRPSNECTSRRSDEASYVDSCRERKRGVGLSAIRSRIQTGFASLRHRSHSVVSECEVSGLWDFASVAPSADAKEETMRAKPSDRHMERIGAFSH